MMPIEKPLIEVYGYSDDLGMASNNVEIHHEKETAKPLLQSFFGYFFTIISKGYLTDRLKFKFLKDDDRFNIAIRTLDKNKGTAILKNGLGLWDSLFWRYLTVDSENGEKRTILVNIRSAQKRLGVLGFSRTDVDEILINGKKLNNTFAEEIINKDIEKKVNKHIPNLYDKKKIINQLMQWILKGEISEKDLDDSDFWSCTLFRNPPLQKDYFLYQKALKEMNITTKENEFLFIREILEKKYPSEKNAFDRKTRLEQLKEVVPISLKEQKEFEDFLKAIDTSHPYYSELVDFSKNDQFAQIYFEKIEKGNYTDAISSYIDKNENTLFEKAITRKAAAKWQDNLQGWNSQLFINWISKGEIKKTDIDEILKEINLERKFGGGAHWDPAYITPCDDKLIEEGKELFLLKQACNASDTKVNLRESLRENWDAVKHLKNEFLKKESDPTLTLRENSIESYKKAIERFKIP